MTDNHEPTSGSRSSAGGSTGGAKSAVTQRLADAKDAASSAYDSTVDAASSAYRSSREGLSTATAKAGDGLEQNPLVALAGGIAIGAVLGALLPRTRQETELLGGVGRAVADRARTATAAAKQAGQEKLDELGLNSSSAKDKAASLVDAAKQVAGSASAAATQAAKDGSATSSVDSTTSAPSPATASGETDFNGIPAFTSDNTGETSVLGEDDGADDAVDLYTEGRSPGSTDSDRP